jgi:uncharacterized membrane protein
MGENNFAPIPTAVYGGSLIMPAIAFTFLVAAIVRVPDQNHALVEEIGRDIKGKISILGYAVAIPIALVLPLAAVAIYIAIATLWIVPDPRFERSATVEASHHEGGH